MQLNRVWVTFPRRTVTSSERPVFPEPMQIYRCALYGISTDRLPGLGDYIHKLRSVARIVLSDSKDQFLSYPCLPVSVKQCNVKSSVGEDQLPQNPDDMFTNLCTWGKNIHLRKHNLLWKNHTPPPPLPPSLPSPPPPPPPRLLLLLGFVVLFLLFSVHAFKIKLQTIYVELILRCQETCQHLVISLNALFLWQYKYNVCFLFGSDVRRTDYDTGYF